MPLSGNITPAGVPQPATTPVAHKFAPTRTSAGPNGNVAPIPGSEPAPAEQQQRRVEPPAGTAEVEAADGADATEPEKGPDAWRFAKLAQKDRLARERLETAKQAEARVKTAEEALAAREAALKAEEAKRAVWRRNPAQLLRDHGYNPEGALQFMLAGEKLTPEQELAARLDQSIEQERTTRAEELQALRDEQAARDTERAEQEKRQEQEELTQQEQVAVRELHADIGDIVAGDPKTFRLLQKAGQRGVAAVYERLSKISDEQFEQSGRRPPLTTKMLERAAAEIEADARKELQEQLSDQDLAAELGLAPTGRRPAARPQTLTSRMPTGQAAPEGGVQRPETEAEKRDRVKGMIAPMLRGGRAR